MSFIEEIDSIIEKATKDTETQTNQDAAEFCAGIRSVIKKQAELHTDMNKPFAVYMRVECIPPFKIESVWQDKCLFKLGRRTKKAVLPKSVFDFQKAISKKLTDEGFEVSEWKLYKKDQDAESHPDPLKTPYSKVYRTYLTCERNEKSLKFDPNAPIYIKEVGAPDSEPTCTYVQKSVKVKLDDPKALVMRLSIKFTYQKSYKN